MRTRLAVLSLATAALMGCAGSSINTGGEAFAPEKIATASTFGARSSDAVTISGDADERAPQWIGAAVRRELEARGLTAAQADADLVGTASVTVKGETTQYVGWTGRHNVTPTVQQADWTDGTLIIEFYDRASNDLVWRGVARGAVKPGAGERQINEAVKAMFTTWPSR